MVAMATDTFLIKKYINFGDCWFKTKQKENTHTCTHKKENKLLK